MEKLSEEEINESIKILKDFGMILSEQQVMALKEMMKGFDKDSLKKDPDKSP